MRTGGNCRTVDREISRFPRKERLHMPGSSTTPGRSDLAMARPKRIAFRTRNGVGTRGLAFAAQWLAYALPYRRFVAVLADAFREEDVPLLSFGMLNDLRYSEKGRLPTVEEWEQLDKRSQKLFSYLDDGLRKQFELSQTANLIAGLPV